MQISVIYCTSCKQDLVQLQLEVGSCVHDAIGHSNLTTKYPELDASALSVGIYGKICTLKTVLHDQDRVEIYRPLLLTPTEARRLRAKKAQNASKK